MRNTIKLNPFKKRYVATHRARVRKIKKLSRHPLFAVPVVTFMVLLLIVAVSVVVATGGHPTLAHSESHIVIISHDHQEQTVPTRAATVGDLLDKANITLNTGDVVEPSADTPITDDNFRVNVYRATPVTIIDGGQRTVAFSAATTGRSIAKQAGIQVFPEDNITLAPTQNFVTTGSIGSEVVIDRAVPVNLNLYGTPVTVRTHAKTVKDLLAEKNIHLAADDNVQPESTAPITPDIQVFVTRHGTVIQSVTQPIPMPVQTVQDDTLSFGTTAVRQQGAPGTEVITYQVQLVNGKEVGRQQIQTVVTQQPVTQIVAQGKAVQIPSDKQAVMRLAGIGDSDFAYVDYIVSRESGWCPTKLQGQIGSCPAYPPAVIPSGLGYGLGQATPGSKMSTAGADWQTNAVTQLIWCNGYAVRTYGGWAGAYNHWVSHHNW
ncbi:MAG TPA: ubiquitin-like domain-containing protein [Candidatus Saccharimonadales bacterium]|nr:ubiquitin-like domain-containing protein [Candidatus Saccharimonadales bacterium]